MKLILVLVYVTVYKVAAVTENYNAQCPNSSTVRVHAPGIGRMSRFKEYKDLVCLTCHIANCKETRLFDGFNKKNDGDRIMSTSNVQDLSLKDYGADEIEVSYKCPGGDVQKVPCYSSYTMKECLTAQCDECKSLKNCEVYAGTKKVSSGKVAVSRGTYQVDTKASKSEKLKRSMEKIKNLVTSGKAKGIASAVGAAVVSNKDKILALAKVIGVSERTLNYT